MTIYYGNLGEVDVDGNTVAQVKSFSLSEDAEALDSTVLGASAFSYSPGLGKTSGSIECLWDHGDTTGQEVMTVGAQVTLILYPHANTAGSKSATISAVITGVSSESNFDQLLPRTFTFTGGGATWATVV